jgi:hypothetical protein
MIASKMQLIKIKNKKYLQRAFYLQTSIYLLDSRAGVGKLRPAYLLLSLSVFFLCCFFWALKKAKDLTPYLYPELKLITVKTF